MQVLRCRCVCFFFFSSRRRHTRLQGDWSSDVCSSDLSNVDEVERIHRESWRLGLKAIALYRDGSKLSQPLSAGDQATKVPMPKDAREMAEALAKLIPELTRDQAARMSEAAFAAKAAPAPLLANVRRRLPSKRHGLTQEAKV